MDEFDSNMNQAALQLSQRITTVCRLLCVTSGVLHQHKNSPEYKQIFVQFLTRSIDDILDLMVLFMCVHQTPTVMYMSSVHAKANNNILTKLYLLQQRLCFALTVVRANKSMADPQDGSRGPGKDRVQKRRAGVLARHPSVFHACPWASANTAHNEQIAPSCRSHRDVNKGNQREQLGRGWRLRGCCEQWLCWHWWRRERETWPQGKHGRGCYVDIGGSRFRPPLCIASSLRLFSCLSLNALVHPQRWLFHSGLA